MIFELLKTRRSVRKFKENEIEDNKIKILLESILLSPTSRGIDPWEFIVVVNREILKNLSESKTHGAEFLANAKMGIIICAYENKSDVWIEDCSIASIILQLAAESLGLSSCWIQIRNRMHDENITAEAFIQKTLEIPENIRVESIIALGYADEKKEPHDLSKLNFNKIFLNKYANKYNI